LAFWAYFHIFELGQIKVFAIQDHFFTEEA